MISIIFFGYNEEKFIKQSILNLAQNIPHKNYEIIIVNDGSIDKTSEEIDQIFVEEIKITKINKLNNQGIAKAVYDGLNKAQGDLVSWLPSDGAYDAESLGKFFDSCKSNDQDLFIGYRSNKKERDFIRFFLSEFLTFILNLIFLKKIKDYNGVISVRKNLLDKIILPNHPSFQWVIIMQLLKNKVKNLEIPIKMTIPEPGDGSSAMNLKTYFSYFLSLLNLMKIILFKKK